MSQTVIQTIYNSEGYPCFSSGYLYLRKSNYTRVQGNGYITTPYSTANGGGITAIRPHVVIEAQNDSWTAYHSGTFTIKINYSTGNSSTYTKTISNNTAKTNWWGEMVEFVALSTENITSISYDFSEIESDINWSSQSTTSMNVTVQVQLEITYFNAGLVTWYNITPSGGVDTRRVEVGSYASYWPESVSGYTFLGWGLTSSSTTPSYTTSQTRQMQVAEDFSFYGIWEANSSQPSTGSSSTAYFYINFVEGYGWTDANQLLTSKTISSSSQTSYNFSSSSFMTRKLCDILGWRDSKVYFSSKTKLSTDLSPTSGYIPASSTDINYYAVFREKYKIKFYKYVNDSSPYLTVSGTKYQGETLSSSEFPSSVSDSGFCGWTFSSSIAGKNYNNLSSSELNYVYTSYSQVPELEESWKKSSLTSDGYFEIAFYGVWSNGSSGGSSGGSSTNTYTVYFVNSITKYAAYGGTVNQGDSFYFTQSDIPSSIGNLNTTKYLHRGWYASPTTISDCSNFITTANPYNEGASGYYLANGDTVDGLGAAASTISNIYVDTNSYEKNPISKISSGLDINGSDSNGNYLWKPNNYDGTNSFNSTYTLVKICFSTTGPGTVKVNYSVNTEDYYDGFVFSELNVANCPFTHTVVTTIEEDEVNELYRPSYVYGAASGTNTGSISYTVTGSGDYYFWVKFIKDQTTTEPNEYAYIKDLSFIGSASSGIQSDVYLYSLHQIKYRHIFENYNGSYYSTTSNAVTIDNYITTANTPNARSGYVFKGWTLKNNSSYTTYSSDNATYFYPANSQIDFTESMINNGYVHVEAASTGYYYLHFYPVWNPTYNINFYNTITGTLLRTISVEKNNDCSFNYSPAALTTTKYDHMGWYDGTGTISSASNPGSLIKGPDAIYKSGTKYYYIADTINNITASINLYSIEQSKYRAVFHNYPHQTEGSDNFLFQDNSNLVIKGYDLSSFPSGTNVIRTGYVFKGWTCYNSDTYTIYDSNRLSPAFCEEGYSIQLTDTLINLAQESDNYFDIHFYPVWNPKLNVIYQDVLHNLTFTDNYCVEKGSDYTLISSYGTNINHYITNNSENEQGYNFVGWVRENKNDDLCTPYIDINDNYLYYPDTSINSSNFDSNKANLYIRGTSSYISVASSSFSNTTYFRRLLIYRSNDDINSITNNLNLYAVWQKKYQVIFKNASGTNISSVFYTLGETVTPLNDSQLPTKTLSTPSISCTNPTPSSGTNYGFQYNSTDEVWESQNAGQNNSYSLGRFSFYAAGKCVLIITALNNSEANYDYGIFSKLDSQLNLNSSKDSDTLINITGKGKTTSYKTYYEIPSAGSYTFDVKYIKDSSVNTADDKLTFSVQFVNLGKTFKGWTKNSSTIEYENSPSSFFDNDSIPSVAESQVNNSSTGGPFQIIYYPVWSSQYSIFFINQDKDEFLTSINNIAYEEDQTFSFNSTINTYTTNGYSLEGWSTSNNKIGPSVTMGSSDYNFSGHTIQRITSNVVLYLILKRKYRIDFYNINKTSIISTFEGYESGSSVQPSTTPSNTNFDFIGWVLNNSGFNYYYALTSTEKSLIYADGASVKNVADTDASRNTQGYFCINYYSVWNKKYNILFKDDLHNTEYNNTNCVSYNNTIDFTNLIKPNTTTDYGYTLIGWRKSSSSPTITYTKVADPTSGSGILTNYGFECVDSTNNVWKSKAPKTYSTYSLGRFSFTTTKPCRLIITAQNDSNSQYHYGIFSELDKQLNPSYIVDTTNVQATGINTRNEYTITYNIPSAGLHTFDVKFRNHNSQALNYCDNLIFSLVFDIPPDNYIGPNVNFSNSLDKDNEHSSITNVTSDLIFYAIQKKKYKLIFVNDSNSTLLSLTTNGDNGNEPFYNGDNNISVPNINLTKSLSVLKGWTTSSSNNARNYSTRITNNFYALETQSIEIKDTDALPVTRTNFTDYFIITFYPVWNQKFTITFKDTISTATSVHEIEKGEDFVFSQYQTLDLNDETSAYLRLGWTLRDYTDSSQRDSICGPNAQKDNSVDYSDNGTILTNLITNNLILYAIQKKKYTLMFLEPDGSYTTYEDYYINDPVNIYFDSYKDENSTFKGWTLDSTKIYYNPINDPDIYTRAEGLPSVSDEQSSSLENGYFYIKYYPVFNSLYTITYYDVDEDTSSWSEITSIDNIEGGTTYTISNSSYYDKIKYEIVGWNTTRSFPISEAPTYNLTGESVTVNSNINFYLACKKRYALEINDIDISNTGNYDITISRGSAIYESEYDIDYYNYGQSITITLTPKGHQCFINKKYDNDTNSSLITMTNHNRTLTFNITLNNSTYDTSSSLSHHKLLYSLGNGVKFTPIIRIQNKQHDNTYCNNNFYVNNIALGDYNGNYITSGSYIQKTIPLAEQYYYLGDTITCEFKHTISSAPELQYYINQVLFYENNTWYSSEDYISKSRLQINSGFSNNYATYTYTHTVTLEDIEEDGKAIQIIPYYVPYNNIIYVKSDQGFIKPIDTSSYTIKIKTGDTYLNEGYIYIFNETASNLQISLTNRDNYIPIQFKYKEPSTSLQTCSIYNFLNYENPNIILPKFYYSDKYTFHSIGLNLSTTDINTYHSDLYELQESGYFGGLQRVEILSKPLNKITITKPNTTINSDSTDNSLIFYINSSNLLNNSIEYSIQDVKDSGMSFKELTIDTSDGIQTINKSQIIDGGLSLPAGWTRQQTTDHTDIITYTNNNFSARNGYIDYITITFAESLPLFYLDSKAIQLYWEGTKAEGLYWENIKLL